MQRRAIAVRVTVLLTALVACTASHPLTLERDASIPHDSLADAGDTPNELPDAQSELPDVSVPESDAATSLPPDASIHCFDPADVDVACGEITDNSFWTEDVDVATGLRMPWVSAEQIAPNARIVMSGGLGLIAQVGEGAEMRSLAVYIGASNVSDEVELEIYEIELEGELAGAELVAVHGQLVLACKDADCWVLAPADEAATTLTLMEHGHVPATIEPRGVFRDYARTCVWGVGGIACLEGDTWGEPLPATAGSDLRAVYPDSYLNAFGADGALITGSIETLTSVDTLVSDTLVAGDRWDECWSAITDSGRWLEACSATDTGTASEPLTTCDLDPPPVAVFRTGSVETPGRVIVSSDGTTYRYVTDAWCVETRIGEGQRVIGIANVSCGLAGNRIITTERAVYISGGRFWCPIG